MPTYVLEIEGTVAEIQERLAEFGEERLRVTIRTVEAPNPLAANKASRKLSVTEKILARAEAMSPEERAQMPSDLAEQHDHYIYGVPKK